MLITTALIALVVVSVAGALIFWANPTRSVNRAIGAGSLLVAAWLACWHMTATAVDGERLFWLRLTSAAGALMPLSLIIIRESILVTGDAPSGGASRRRFLWLLVPAILAVVPFTEAFTSYGPKTARGGHGWGYGAYFGGLVAFYGYLLFDTLRSLRTISGGRRLELQVWLVGGCMAAIVIYSLIGMTALTGDPSYRRLQPIVVLLFYAGIAYAITTHRILNARQIMLVSVERIVLVASVAGVAYLLDKSLALVLSELFAFVTTTVLALWFAGWASSKLNQFFRFFPEATVARQEAFAVAQRETGRENLEGSFLRILKGWGQSEHAIIITGGRDALRGGGIELSGDSSVLETMRQLRWVTPERLVRERPTKARDEVGGFLKEHSLGVLVIGEGPALTALVGVGVAASRRPFTYPHVTQLMELASIIEGAVERAHFSAKVQHTEQLATVGLLGASLAHEIRNPLVTIKTFVQLLPKHHQDPAFREKFFKLIGDEVGRIDQLTEQLLDLASPRAYIAQMVELHPVLRASLDLVAAKAADKSIQLLTDLQANPDQAFTDASAAKQVVLNLCFNAIQAVESGQTAERWVRIATRNIPRGIEMVVADSGPGIAAEMRPRLFQPFQTTKSSGFGLGLAICSDILANLNASISIDPAEPGCGATFRVIFPCQPLLS